MTQQTLVKAVADIIAKVAGFHDQVRRGRPEPVARRLNNPGLLTRWRIRTQGRDDGEFPTEFGFVRFPDLSTGESALRTQCHVNIVRRRLSTREFFRGKPAMKDAAGYGGFISRRLAEDPQAYISAVVRHLGIDENTPLIKLVT